MNADPSIKDSQGRECRLQAEILFGFSFRSLIEYIYGTNKDGIMIFTPRGILFTRSDGEKTVTNTFELTRFTTYKFSHDTDIQFGFTTSNLRTITGEIGKKDNLRLVVFKNDPNLYLQIIGADSMAQANDNYSKLLYQNIGGARIDDDDDIESTKPNCEIPLGNFCKLCSKIIKATKSPMIFKVFPNGVSCVYQTPGVFSAAMAIMVLLVQKIALITL